MSTFIAAFIGTVFGAWLHAAIKKWEYDESIREWYRQEWPGEEEK